MKTKNLSFTYSGNSTPTLHGISTIFTANTITALLGPNGSGKTTLMQLLAGHIRNHSGEIQLNNQPASLDQLSKDVFYVGNASEYAEYPIGDLLAFLRLRMNWNEALYQQLLKRFNLQPKLRKAFKKLSSGESNLLMAVFALASEAPVTLLDEIQANLDVPTRYRLYETIIELNARTADGAGPARTFVISSHMVEELETLCEEVKIIDRGKLVFANSTEALRGKYLSIQGSLAEIEKFQAAYPQLQISSTRKLGSYAELVVSVPATGLPKLNDFPTLTSQPLSFQDAFVAQLAKD